MAELLTTDEENAAATYLEWDDAALGKAVKSAALLCTDHNGKHAIPYVGAAVFLISEAIRSGADNLTVSLDDASASGENLGDWVVTARRVLPVA
jgi:hypothetical protein